jgi:hypothetical protein
MRRSILLFLFVILLTGYAYGQRESSERDVQRARSKHTARKKSARASPRSLPTPSPIERSAEEINDARPAVSYNILFKDMEAVEASLPAVKYIFSQRGFTDREAESATLYGWKQLRIKKLKPTATLSPKELVNYVSGFGKLMIKSIPTGATVELNGQELPDKTDAVTWPSAGTYRLKLSMDGYESVEDKCVIEEGKLTHFEKQLKAIKKRN